MSKIEPCSEFGASLGFTKDKFAGYLWQQGNRIIIPVILSLQPGEGNFSRLIETIEAKGYKLAIANPFLTMQRVLKKKGFVPHWEKDEIYGSNMKAEVWERDVVTTR